MANRVLDMNEAKLRALLYGYELTEKELEAAAGRLNEGRSEERRYIEECQFVVRWKEREKTGEECLQEVRDMVSLAEIG